MLSALLVMAMFGTAFAILTKPEGCGTTVGCYTDCDGGSCSFVVTWADDGDNIDFSLKHTVPDGDRWVALGLSEDTKMVPKARRLSPHDGDNIDFSLKHTVPDGDRLVALGLSEDTKMGEDIVFDCIMEDSVISVQKSYNPAKYNEVLPSQEQVGLLVTSTDISDGVLSCQFTHPRIFNSTRIVKDLQAMTWYLMVATGSATGGVKYQHSLDPTPAVTPSKVDLLSNEDVGGRAKIVYVLVKIHGCLMIYAWIFAASIGIVVARYYKRMWPNDKHCREKVWFTWHRILMLSAFATCIASFVIIFLEVEGWAYLEGHSRWQKAHPYLGVVVTTCCFINPILAAVRPHPDAKFRPAFNWTHWIFGTLAHVLSTLTIIVGVTLTKSAVPFHIVWILIAYAAYQVLMELFLEIHECCIAGSGDKYYKDGTMKDPRGSRLKKICLFIHILIISAFTIVCIVILAIN